jgi:transcriptional regulator with XRE-family HTH domain
VTAMARSRGVQGTGREASAVMIGRVDDRRVGLILRMLRRRRGWRQLDLAARSGCSQSFVSQLERGHVDRVALVDLRRVLGALDARGVLEVRWRGGAVDRLLDEDHAAMAGEIVASLAAFGWSTALEVTYARYGERGAIDVLAFRPDSRSLLVVELKTELTSLEETLRRLDQKVRLGPAIAAERLGWEATAASRLLVLPESTTTRRRLATHAAVLGATLPKRGVELRRWLKSPDRLCAGIGLLPPSRAGSASDPAAVLIASGRLTGHSGATGPSVESGDASMVSPRQGPRSGRPAA